MTADAQTRQEAPAAEASPVSLEIRGVRHDFRNPAGELVPALQPTDLTVAKGEFLAIVGPSGCGKTTLLNIVAGLVQQTGGEVSVEGEPPRAGSRKIGYLFARDSLLPWRTVLANAELVMEVHGVNKAERRERALDMLDKVGLSAFAASHPAQLSQGMRQRVAIARTLAPLPSIVLLDEPFSALDAHTKLLLQETFSELWQTMSATIILITHDLHEAVALADRVLIFTRRPGRVKKVLTVDLPRPRSVLALQEEDHYHHLYEEAWTSLRDEVVSTNVNR